ncbi:hypothetical protein [uncultured Gemmiger sp.]|uniref:hypothetical protein n=1 Tax=uncultured Gemmiger sp. TaxID=1623490 RepID=UPI002609EF8C|nr:hypothetical protein [uncultured Gemmiger sp.]
MPAANKVPLRDAGEKQLAYIRAIQTANAIMRSRTQPDSNGLYPDEIGFLILLDSGISSAGPLYYDNCLGKLLIPSISKIREDLRSKGMLTLGTPQDGLYYTNYYELRRFYKEYELGQPPKKKAELIKELQDKVPNDILKKRFPPRDTYCLTPKAYEEVESHPGIEFALLVDKETGVNYVTGALTKGRISIWNVERRFSQEQCIELRNFSLSVKNCEQLSIEDLPSSYHIWCIVYRYMCSYNGLHMMDKCKDISIQSFINRYMHQFPAHIYTDMGGNHQYDLSAIEDMSMEIFYKDEWYSAAGIRNRCYLFVHNSQGKITSCIRGSLVGFLLNMYDHIGPY